MPKVTKAIIPVAGFGTRMYPASRAVKKEFFPVIDPGGRAKPVIQVILEEVVDSGIEEVCLITQPGDEAVFRAYFEGAMPADLEAKLHAKDWARRETERLHDLGARLAFVEQPSMEGFGHAVHCCREWIGGAPCLLMLGDHLYRSSTGTRCARQLLDVYEAEGVCAVAVERAGEDQLHLCGTIGGTYLGDGRYEIAEFREKPDVAYARERLCVDGNPDKPYLCVFGQYALSPTVFDCLEHIVSHDIRENGEIQFTGALEMARQREGRAVAYETRGRRYDTGVPEEYVRTISEFGRP